MIQFIKTYLCLSLVFFMATLPTQLAWGGHGTNFDDVGDKKTHTRVGPGAPEELYPAPSPWISKRKIYKLTGCCLALPLSILATRAISDYTFKALRVPLDGPVEAAAGLVTLAISGCALGRVGWKLGDYIYNWFYPNTP